ncbi:MAG: yajC, partial [Acidimicrobiaceae bacterium]|nr:yajC [Acidimicrobiaceae bacterium]
FLVVVAAVYFLFIAPQRRKMRAQANQQPQFEVGDEVVTKGGLYGRIEGFDGDRVQVEIAPGTTVEMLQASIARRIDAVGLEPDADEEDAEDEADGEQDEHDEHEVNNRWEPPSGDTEVPSPPVSAKARRNGSDAAAPSPADEEPPVEGHPR